MIELSSVKAVLFDFNGTIVNDEPIHKQLVLDLLIAENMRSEIRDYRQISLGKSDRDALPAIWAQQGRYLTPQMLERMIARKTAAYRFWLAAVSPIPIYDGIVELLDFLQSRSIPMAIVTGALRVDVEAVLQRADIARYFATIVASEDVTTGKPSPEGYNLAVANLNAKYPALKLQPPDCLAIEDTLPGLAAARAAGIITVGVAHTYPLHILQRQADWAIDRPADLIAELTPPESTEEEAGKAE
jgi:HAD superfamily hydrolase (TIGR01509 family)